MSRKEMGSLIDFFRDSLIANFPAKCSAGFLNFKNPCYINDEVTIEGEVIDRRSATRLITLKITIYNQTGKCLIDGVAKVIVR